MIKEWDTSEIVNQLIKRAVCEEVGVAYGNDWFQWLIINK